MGHGARARPAYPLAWTITIPDNRSAGIESLSQHNGARAFRSLVANDISCAHVEHRRNDMRSLLFAFCLCLIPTVLSAQPAQPVEPARQDRVAQVEANIETVHRDVAILKEVTSSRLDAQDQRIGDLNGWTEQQANHMAAISNVTAWVATLITLIAVAAGFIIYFSMKGRASAEAREAAQHWFLENTNALHQQIDALKTEAETLRSQVETLRQRIDNAHGEIDRMTTEVDDHAKESRAAIDQAAQQILAVSSKHQDSRTVDPLAVETVRQANLTLETKPVNTFNADDHMVRGLSEYTSGRFDSALSSFDKALELARTEVPSPLRYAKLLLARGAALLELQRNVDALEAFDEIDRRYGTDAHPALRAQCAKAFFNKGIMFARLGRSQEEIAMYDMIDQRYGTDALSDLREIVARALNSRGFARIMVAKRCWKAEAERGLLLNQAIADLQCAMQQYASEDIPIVLGNLGYAFFLSSDSYQAELHARECLRRGREALLEHQRDYAKTHRVEPQDSKYERLLDRLWQQVQPTG
jgi:tetratricopeptide (TPR) repeat protein